MHNHYIKSYQNLLNNNLYYFLRKCFISINPGIEYLHNWHIDLIIEYLLAVQSGKVKRLIINIPPRSLKSVCVSVTFPMWLLGHNPASRIIVASYSDILSTKHSTDCRIIAESNWYSSVFNEFKISANQNEKHKFATSLNGFRFATSVGGSLTGEGGDFLIIDDPHNPQQVMSSKYRQKTLDWFSNTFSSRLNNKKKGAIIIVMQRLHPDDLTGYLLEKGGWDLLSIPAIAEKDEIIKFGNFNKFRGQGELLHNDREGFEEIERMKLDMGSYVFSAQYQQNPVLNKGGMIKPQWLMRYKELPIIKSITLSFDTAIKTGAKNDPTVCSVWGENENNFYLIEVYREWLEYPELKKKSMELIKKWKADAVLIEDKASGQSLIQDLRKEMKEAIIPIKVSQDKITRMGAVSAIIEAGRVFLPLDATWLADFENELYGFPNCEHDDQVDSISQFLNWIRGRVNVEKRFDIRRL